MFDVITFVTWGVSKLNFDRDGEKKLNIWFESNHLLTLYIMMIDIKIFRNISTKKKGQTQTDEYKHQRRSAKLSLRWKIYSHRAHNNQTADQLFCPYNNELIISPSPCVRCMCQFARRPNNNNRKSTNTVHLH